MARPSRSGGDVSIGARDVDIARVLERHPGAADHPRLVERGDVQHLQPVTIDDEAVAELDLHAARVDEIGCANLRRHFWMEWILERNDHQRPVRDDVGKCPGDGNSPRPGENSVRIEGGGAFEKVVRRVAIEQRTDADDVPALRIPVADHDESFVPVGDVEEPVHRGGSSVLRSRDAGFAAGPRPASSGVATAVAYFVFT